MKRRACTGLICAGALFCLPAAPVLAQMESQISPRPVDPNATPDSPLNPRRSLLRPQPVEPDPVRPSMRIPPTPHPEALRPKTAPAGSGFTMTLIRGPHPPDAPAEPLTRARDVASRLMQCWTPPRAGVRQEITARLAFSRAGRPITEPRIAYVGPGLTPPQRAALRESLLSAIYACVPLRFTPELASAIAGRPFAIHFIAQP